MPQLQRLPLYRQVAQLLERDYVKGREPGAFLPTERELEALMSVSSITIRAALRELVQRGVIERRRGRGTTVAARSGEGRHVALLLEADPSSPMLSPYYLKLLEETREALFRLGLASRPYFGHLRVGLDIGELTSRDFLDDLQRERLCGVITLFGTQHPSWVGEVERRGLPLLGECRLSNRVTEIDWRPLARFWAASGRSRVIAVDWEKGYEPSPLPVWPGVEVERCTIPFEWQSAAAAPAWREYWKRWEGEPAALLVEDDLLLAQAASFLLWPEAVPSLEAREVVVLGSDAVELHPPQPVTQLSFSVRAKAARLAATMADALRGERPSAPALLPSTLSIQHPTPLPSPAAMMQLYA